MVCAFLETSNPANFPPLIDEYLDQVSGEGGFDRFFERPIVPLSEALSRPPEEQFNEYTSETAKFIGKTFKVSPRRVDHAIRGIFGGLGNDVVEASETLLGLRTEKPNETRELRDIPVVGVLFQRGGQVATSPRSINEFYDNLQEIRRKSVNEKPKQRDMRLLFIDAQKSISALMLMKRNEGDQGLRQKYQQAAIEIARDANQKLKSGQVSFENRRQFRLRRRELDVSRKRAEASS